VVQDLNVDCKRVSRGYLTILLKVVDSGQKLLSKKRKILMACNQGCGVGRKMSDSDTYIPNFSDSDSDTALSEISDSTPDSDSLT